MEQKTLAEIKTRTATAREEGFDLQQFDDLDALASEAERLTEENDVLKSECKAHIRQAQEQEGHDD